MSKYLVFFIIIINIITFSCKKTSKEEKINIQVNTPIKKVEYFNLPSPFEINASIDFSDIDTTKLTKLKNPQLFTNQQDIAIKTGMYMADLSFLARTSYNNLLNLYANQIYKMLIILEFPHKQIDSIYEFTEKNIYNYDTMKYFISNLLYQVDAYLKNTGQIKNACQITYGVWIESNYIILNALKNYKDTNKIHTLLADQYLVLNNALQYTDTSVLETSMINNMKELKNMFGELVKFTKIKIKDTLWDTIYYKTQMEYDITKAKISKINKKFTTIRNNLINK